MPTAYTVQRAYVVALVVLAAVLELVSRLPA